MPAPKNPNTAAATATNVKRKHARWADELREAGYVVITPEGAATLMKADPSGVGAFISGYLYGPGVTSP